MTHSKRLQLMLVLALVVAGLAAAAALYVPLAGDLAAYKKGSFDITEVEQVASSKGEMAGAGRGSSILGVAPDELRVAGSAGAASKVVRESS